jgi:Arm DNA-binding domain/Phage integrase central domain
VSANVHRPPAAFVPPVCPRKPLRQSAGKQCSGSRNSQLAHSPERSAVQKTLTDVLVRSLAAPASGRLEITDARCPGLTIRVSTSGAKSWSFRFRDPRTGAIARATIGSYPDVPLAAARQRATELRQTVAAGQNPIEMKRQARRDAETETFQALAERYLREYAYRFKRSAADEHNLRLHVLPLWGRRRYDEIQRRDVIELCVGMVAGGRAIQANRVQALISTIYSFALDADLVAVNPCHRLKKRGVETVGRRVLSDSERRLFWLGIVLPPPGYRSKISLVRVAPSDLPSWSPARSATVTRCWLAGRSCSEPSSPTSRPFRWTTSPRSHGSRGNTN